MGFGLSDLKTVDSKHELNHSLNAQLGEAHDNFEKYNEPILEENESIQDDPDYFYASINENIKPKETFQMISKSKTFQISSIMKNF